MEVNIDLSKKINEKFFGIECEISSESWAKEENSGKKLNKPFRTPKGPKKFSVYVKNDKGNVVKVNFGDPNMEIKRDDPNRRKSFRARHNCSNPGPKDKARYWSCKQWRAGTKVQGSGEEAEEELLWYLDESEGERKGLWHNIREKKKREGKNYKPAKKGDKDYPDEKSLKKAQGPKKKTKAEEDFKPHAMYDKDGKKYMADTYEDHLKMKKMGYTHKSDSNQNSPRMYAKEIQKAYMNHCVKNDKDLVNTAGMDGEKTYSTCAMQYKKSYSTLNKEGKDGLTEEQKKLPAPIQKAILKKMKANQNSPRAYAEDIKKKEDGSPAKKKKKRAMDKGEYRDKDGKICKTSKSDEDAGYPPNCNDGYKEEYGKCIPIKKDKQENKLRPGKEDGNQNSPRMY